MRGLYVYIVHIVAKRIYDVLNSRPSRTTESIDRLARRNAIK